MEFETLAILADSVLNRGCEAGIGAQHLILCPSISGHTQELALRLGRGILTWIPW